MRNQYDWTESPTSELPDEYFQAIGGHPLVAQILALRGYGDLQYVRGFLDPSVYRPAPPSTLPDLVTASDYLSEAARRAETVLIWGDFDVDGQTASALLIDALQGIGLNVEWYIPDRLTESHGIKPDSLQREIARVHPSILLTCDTGVSAHASIDYAKSRGLVVLVTDHHDLPPVLPDAHAIINPKRVTPDHPLATLPGVGVAYKLIEHLYAAHDRTDECVQFLDLVALGIVADVAEQTRDTRYLLQIGLERLKNTQRIGLRALMDVAGLDPDRLTATDIGFQIGPRLNAAGRLADASPAVELLTTSDPGRAQVLAAQLEGLNNQRRFQTQQIATAAMEQIERDPTLLDWEALVLANPTWHPGILGIVASRLAEQFMRPVVLLNTADDNAARGSARSAPGYDIGAAIAAQADLLIAHGGHPGAAGLSLHPDDIPAFRRRLSNTLHETRDRSAQAHLQIDAWITLPELTLDLAAELNRLAPFGEGNPRVTLATTELTLKSAAYVGRNQEHRRLTVEDSAGNRQTLLWWNSGDQVLPQGLFDIAYQLEINTFQGQTELQLILIDYRRSPGAPAETSEPQYAVIDYRREQNTQLVLDRLKGEYPEAAIWAEGYQRAVSPGVPLHDLSESQTLVIYTTPSGPQALQEAQERTKATTLVLLGINPPIITLAQVQRRLLELIKYVITHTAGRTTVAELASATAQTQRTIRRALDYFIAQGEIAVEWKRGGSIIVTLDDKQPGQDVAERSAALSASVAETAAYRTFFNRATPTQIFGEEDA